MIDLQYDLEAPGAAAWPPSAVQVMRRTPSRTHAHGPSAVKDTVPQTHGAGTPASVVTGLSRGGAQQRPCCVAPAFGSPSRGLWVREVSLERRLGGLGGGVPRVCVPKKAQLKHSVGLFLNPPTAKLWSQGGRLRGASSSVQPFKAPPPLLPG